MLQDDQRSRRRFVLSASRSAPRYGWAWAAQARSRESQFSGSGCGICLAEDQKSGPASRARRFCPVLAATIGQRRISVNLANQPSVGRSLGHSVHA